MVHPRAERWRSSQGSPFRVLVPAWVTMWIGMGCLTGPWRHLRLYSTAWSWASGRCFVRCRHLPLFPIRSALQLETTRRLARSIAESPRATARHHRDTVTGPPSGVPGTFVRDAGVEPRDRAGGLLESDGICRHHGSCDDSHGGGGIGEAVRDRVQSVPAFGSGGAAENAPVTCRFFTLAEIARQSFTSHTN